MLRKRSRATTTWPRISSNFKCCTAFGEICRCRSSTKAIAFGCTSHSVANGFHTLCDGWPNDPPTFHLSYAASCATVGNRLLRIRQTASIDLIWRRLLLTLTSAVRPLVARISRTFAVDLHL